MILIPVKNLSNAKQRLSSVLDPSSRRELAQAMLHDVVSEIAAWRRRPVCALVSSDPFALELARHYDWEVIPDPANPGETGAVAMATEICIDRGMAFTLVIPADIPLIQTSELDEIMRQAPAQGSVLVPAADGRGTNAAFRRPANLFALKFGNDSFGPHLAAARSTGKPCRVVQLPAIALDVDHPLDLPQLISRPGETRAQKLLRRWSLDRQLLAAGTPSL